MVGSRKTVGLLILGSLALGLRIGVVAALSGSHNATLAYEHGRIAENLLAGRGFSIEFLGTEGPTSQQAPFYPVLLWAAWALFGVATPGAILAVQLLQCLAGTALVLTVVWLTWSLLPRQPSVGWVAGAAAAVYPTHLYMVTHLQVALWAALVLTLLLAVVVSPRWKATWRGAILAGLLSGLLLLVEPILALALPVCAAAFFLGDGSRDRPIRFRRGPLARLALMTAVAVAAIAPWLVRNWRVHGEPVFIKSTFGYAFWQANNPASWGTDKIPKHSAETLRLAHDGSLADTDRALWEARHETLYIDDVLLKPNGYAEFAGLSEPQRSRLLGRRARAFILENPSGYLRLCLRRLRYFLLFDETNPKASNRIYRIATVTWLVLAAMGLWISADRWRALWPTYLIFACVTLFHVLVITSVRFRIPLEPISFIWIATAVAPLAARLIPRHTIRVYRPGEISRDPLADQPLLKGPHYRETPARRRAG